MDAVSSLYPHPNLPPERGKECRPAVLRWLTVLSAPLTPLLLAVVLLSTVEAAPQDSPVKERHHGESLKQCVSCHQNADSPSFRTAMFKDCVECHNANRTKGALQQVALKSESGMQQSILAENGTVTPIQKKAKAKSLQGTAGMTLPLYYNETRIGKDPNPMVRVQAGAFTMGSNTRMPDEGPLHTAKLKTFLIDKYEVTNLQYQRFIEATGRHSPQHFQNRTFPQGKIDHPVTYVSWYDAKAYCEWAGKRLPSDAEWEKAARGTDGRTFPWGDEFDVNNANTPARWQSLSQEGDTTPVGAFPSGVSPYGLHDMAGNVWEWTDSWYRQYPGNTHPSENYGEHYKTLKGGSWWDCSFYQCGLSAPVYNRSFFDRQTKNSSFGFRCAKDEK